MGFEQLAELRAQLAAKAKQERNAKRPAAPTDAGAKPKSGDQPSRGAAGRRREGAAASEACSDEAVGAGRSGHRRDRQTAAEVSARVPEESGP